MPGQDAQLPEAAAAASTSGPAAAGSQQGAPAAASGAPADAANGAVYRTFSEMMQVRCAGRLVYGKCPERTSLWREYDLVLSHLSQLW